MQVENLCALACREQAIRKIEQKVNKMYNLKEYIKATPEELRTENLRLARLVTELLMKNEQLRSKLADHGSTAQPLIPAQRIP